MDQNTLKIKALNPVIKAKTTAIIEEISNFEGVLSVELNHDDSYSFTFNVDINENCNATELTGKIRELLKFHSSSILAINK